MCVEKYTIFAFYYLNLMGKWPKYDVLLFSVLLVLLFLPMVVEHTGIIKLEPLHGVTKNQGEEMPQLTFEGYVSGDFPKELESYLSCHFGFREFIIRIYNQYLWDFYKKTYANDIVVGKDNWLYVPLSVSDYFGKEMPKWYSSADEARAAFDKEARYISWVHDILKENGVDFLLALAPEKSHLYPEHLPDGEFDTTTFNACHYFTERFDEMGFPYVEMTKWFQEIKDTIDYQLIPQTGGHWNFSSVYAADSLFRFMGALKGVDLPEIRIGELHESGKYSMLADRDLENLLNLQRKFRSVPFAKEADVAVEVNEESVKTKVLFVGNSFFWRIANYVPLREMFDDVEFWYYNSTAYYGEGFKETCKVGNLRLLEKLLDFDYVVWITTGNQLNKGSLGFAKNAVLALCVDDSLMQANVMRVADSLRNDSVVQSELAMDSLRDREMLLTEKARNVIKQDPSMIRELSGESLPSIRNREIPYAKVIKDIRKDSVWMAALAAQGFLRTANLNLMLHAETDRVWQGKPLYRDQLEEIQFSYFCQGMIDSCMEDMRKKPKTMVLVSEDAKKNNKLLGEALRDDAIWLIRQKYKLDSCRLIDNPDAVIDINPMKQSQQNN